LANWSHRDCEGHCYWMIPQCQEMKKQAVMLDSVIKLFETMVRHRGDTLHLDSDPTEFLESLCKIREQHYP